MIKHILALFFLLGMAVCGKSDDIHADSSVLKKHVLALVQGPGHRNIADTASLDKAAKYIYDDFRKYRDSVAVQTYEIKGKKYHNIICSFGPANAPRIVVGAHYDVCGDRPGADDNASGVAGLL